MTVVIGRDHEKAELNRVMQSSHAELVVVYGRRRIGKTYLIRQHLKDQIVFELTGLHNESYDRQLENFAAQLKSQGGKQTSRPATWLEAFEQLKSWLKRHKPAKKRVLFFDEFPWLATRRSGFLSAFEAFWNTYASRDPSIKCVICGSAASWMIHKIINARGGLHNRATSRLRLSPFTLSETKQYLEHQRVRLNDFQIAELYMAIGGIPHYLQRVEAGKSAAQNIDRLCFRKEGLLKNEFMNLYQSLFENADQHEAIVRALASKHKGLTRSELIQATGLASGGTLTKVLNELVESGFVVEMPAWKADRKNSLWRLVDEYSLFYFNWIETNRMSGQDIWLAKSAGQKWKSWCGYAFENVALTHIPQIKKALGISGVLTEEASWHYVAKASHDMGAQVDFLIDRHDHCINLCEVKFTADPFTIDKRYATELQRKAAVFRQRTGTRKAIFLTMVSASGLIDNIHSQAHIANEVKLEDLFYA